MFRTKLRKRSRARDQKAILQSDPNEDDTAPDDLSMEGVAAMRALVPISLMLVAACFGVSAQDNSKRSDEETKGALT